MVSVDVKHQVYYSLGGFSAEESIVSASTVPYPTAEEHQTWSTVRTLLLDLWVVSGDVLAATEIPDGGGGGGGDETWGSWGAGGGGLRMVGEQHL